MRVWEERIKRLPKVHFQPIPLPTLPGQLTKWPYHRRGRPARLRAGPRGKAHAQVKTLSLPLSLLPGSRGKLLIGRARAQCVIRTH